MKRIAPKGSSAAFVLQALLYDSDECLIWPFRLSAKGYGLAVLNGVQKPASRWVCQLAHGMPAPDRNEAAHSCGKPSCVNPRHLRWATAVENQSDRVAHGTDNRGSRNGKTKLTDDDIRAIRSAAPNLPALSKAYRVSRGCISKIRSRQRWGHVQ